MITPSGYYHKDCVFDVGDDATIDDNNNVIHADGTMEPLPGCEHANFASLDDLNAGIPNAGGESRATEPSFTGWVSNENKWAASWYKKISATWSVPTNPSRYTGQTIYLWPGFEPNGVAAVVQPVLGYGPSGNGGGKFWTIGSWWCTSKVCPHSTFKRVSVGDVIEGSASGASCTSGGVCTWTITTKDKNTGATTTLTRRDPHPMSLAVTTLEVWNLESCSELPSSGGEPFDVSVENGNGSTSNAAWTAWRSSSVSVHCDYTERASGAGHTYLFWNH